MKDAATDTKALIEMYSGESEELRDFLFKDQKHLFDKVLPDTLPDKQKKEE